MRSETVSLAVGAFGGTGDVKKGSAVEPTASERARKRGVSRSEREDIFSGRSRRRGGGEGNRHKVSSEVACNSPRAKRDRLRKHRK